MDSVENKLETKPIKAPLTPILVLLIAILLPGMGQVINNTPVKGLVMITFMVILGLITFNLAEAHISMVGKLAGGILFTRFRLWMLITGPNIARKRLSLIKQLH